MPNQRRSQPVNPDGARWIQDLAPGVKALLDYLFNAGNGKLGAHDHRFRIVRADAMGKITDGTDVPVVSRVVRCEISDDAIITTGGPDGALEVLGLFRSANQNRRAGAALAWPNVIEEPFGHFAGDQQRTPKRRRRRNQWQRYRRPKPSRNR